MAQRWNLRAVAGLCEFHKLFLEVGEIHISQGLDWPFPSLSRGYSLLKGTNGKLLEISVCRKCPSVWRLKCVQLHNCFRLWIGSFRVNIEQSAEYAFLNRLSYKSWWVMSWGRIYLCTDTWNSDQSCQGYTQKPILLRFWEKFHCQFCYSPATLFLSSRNSIGKKDDKVGKKNRYRRERKNERKRTRKKDQKKICKKKNCVCACAKNNSILSHCHSTSSWRKPGPKKKVGKETEVLSLLKFRISRLKFYSSFKTFQEEPPAMWAQFLKILRYNWFIITLPPFMSQQYKMLFLHIQSIPKINHTIK